MHLCKKISQVCVCVSIENVLLLQMIKCFVVAHCVGSLVSILIHVEKRLLALILFMAKLHLVLT